jgi:hypothetical protein
MKYGNTHIKKLMDEKSQMKAQEKLEGIIQKANWKYANKLFNGKWEDKTKLLAKDILSNTKLIKMIVDEFVVLDEKEILEILRKFEYKNDIVEAMSIGKSKVLKIKEGK